MNDHARWWDSVSANPRPRRPVLVVAVADDPHAQSTLAEDFGAQWAQRTADGATATARIAAELDVPILVLDDSEIPDHHDLILLADAGRGLTTRAAEIAVSHFGAEPQLVVGYGSGISDRQWMDKVLAVRSVTGPEVHLPAPVAALAAVLQSAAQRDVPVLLDGAVSAAAAAVATRCPPMQIPVMGDEPTQQFFADRIEAGVWSTSGIGPGLGLGALSGLAMLRLALLAADV
jgi:hypothetical protein